MEEKAQTVRKTVSLDKKLVDESMVLMESLKVDSFSQHVSMALQKYNTDLLLEMESEPLTKKMQAAVRKELAPITSRITKALYRYGVYIDILMQLVAYDAYELTDEQFQYLYKQANARMQRSRGIFNLKEMLQDNWSGFDEEDAY